MTANEKEISVIAGASFFVGRSDLYPARGAGSICRKIPVVLGLLTKSPHLEAV